MRSSVSARCGRFVAAVLCTALAGGARASVTRGAWPSGTIEMLLQLDATAPSPRPASGSFSDGSANWNAAVLPALDLWNARLTRSHLSGSITASTGSTQNNGVNDVLFASTYAGQPFGSRTLAVTLISAAGASGLRYTETDLVFNTAFSWDSYRGALRANSVVDIRRVALHELGHVLGLDHPDEADPPQAVAAIMNSVVSNVETLQPDDIAGATALYGTAIPPTQITTQPTSQSVVEGGQAGFTLGLGGTLAPPETATRKYAWFFTPVGGSRELLFTVHEGELPLGAAQLDDAGIYQVEIDTPEGETRSTTASLSVAPVALDAGTRLGNISTRGLAGTGDRTMIVGFVVTGGQTRRVLLRAVGPGLTRFGVGGVVADPALDLKNSSQVTIASNDNWGDNGAAAALQAAFTQAQAFDLAGGSADAALIATLTPGTYTALVGTKGGADGVALVEAYDLDDPGRDSRLGNLSTRGFVATGAQILIAGFVVHGPGPRRYLLRAAGDTLQQHGVSGGTLDDPVITLFDGDGNRLRTLDDWDSPEFLQPKLTTAFATVSAFALGDRQESALLLTLVPGAYTLQVGGFGGGTGIALVEAYEMPP